MSKKFWYSLGLMAVMLLAFVACERPASKAPVAVPQTTSGAKTPLPPADPNGIAATQTAQAVISKFNMPTSIVTNAQGTKVAITQVPPTLAPIGTQPTPTNQAPGQFLATKPAEHVIAKGETVMCLARRYDVNPDEIISLNKLENPGSLSIGDKLKIPASGKFPGDRKANFYERPDIYNITGETTASEVACWYGDVYPEEVMQANNLKSNDLPAGTKTLNLP
ncbi:MAG: LysM peptidoglycan-binding domain-containing protein [Anaerolineaceae bacterium]|nr:LysM peptidoglycan-binding domain-containing protein [Anaerolineaceae bacterium]